MSKPYKGEIHEWSILKHPTGEISIFGKPVGHPSLHNWIRTSPIVKREPPDYPLVETKNSVYLLVGSEQEPPSFIKEALARVFAKKPKD